MGWIALTVIFMILIAIGVIVALAMKGKTRYSNRTNEQIPDPTPAKAAWGVVTLLLVVWVVISVFQSIRVVDNGEVGVVRTFGQLGSVLPSGTHFVAPYSNVDTINVQVQQDKYLARPSEDDLKHDNVFPLGVAGSKDTQQVYLDISVNYQVSPKDLVNLLKTVGVDWKTKLVPPRIAQISKDVTRQYPAKDLLPNRENVRAEIRKRLADELDDFSVVVTDVNVTNIDFTKEFQALIEQTVAATQEAAKAQAQVAITQAQAQQAVAQAEGAKQVVIEQAQGNAESIRLGAEANANATVTQATAQADATKLNGDAVAAANRAIASSLTTEFIQYYSVERLNPSVQTIVTPANWGNGLLLDPSALIK